MFWGSPQSEACNYCLLVGVCSWKETTSLLVYPSLKETALSFCGGLCNCEAPEGRGRGGRATYGDNHVRLYTLHDFGGGGGVSVQE